MASQLSIWNRALQKMGSEQLVDLDENNKRSRALERAWEPVRDALLEQYPWTFAKKLVNLTKDGTYNPEWKYSFQYILPADALAVLEADIEDSYEVVQPRYSATDPATMPSKVAIATDFDGTLPVKYTARVTNTEIYSPLFNELLATALALETCEEITQSNAKKESLKDDYKMLNRQAKSVHTKQRTPEQPQDGSWWASRW